MTVDGTSDVDWRRDRARDRREAAALPCGKAAPGTSAPAAVSEIRTQRPRGSGDSFRSKD